MITKEKLEMAVKSLNNATYEENGKQKDLIEIKIALGDDDKINIENFMVVCENVPVELEERIPDLVADIYNDLKDQLENTLLVDINLVSNKQAIKKEQLKQNKNSQKENIKECKESRPNMLKRKILEYGGETVTIEKLIADAELLTKYSNHKSWIKNDFAKLLIRKK